MIIIIIIGVGDTGENKTCPAMTPFFPTLGWGKAKDGSPELSHVYRGVLHMGTRGNIVHTQLKAYPQRTKGDMFAKIFL
jgi:hypothetical protein